jgi:hypothetical protein
MELMTPLMQLEDALRALRIAGINLRTWLTVGKHLKEDALQRLIISVKDPQAADFLNRNLEGKLRAMSEEKDTRLLLRILEDERVFLTARHTV